MPVPGAWVPSSVRSRSVQRCSLCRLGDLRVLRPARRIHIRLRGRVLHNSPQPASVRPAVAPIVTALGTFWRSSRCCGVSVSLPLPLPPLPAPSWRYAPRYFVGGIPPPCLATCSAPKSPNRVGACRSARHSAPCPVPQSTPRRASLLRHLPCHSLGFARMPAGARRATPPCLATCSAPRSPNRVGACRSARHSTPCPVPQSSSRRHSILSPLSYNFLGFVRIVAEVRRAPPLRLCVSVGDINCAVNKLPSCQVSKRSANRQIPPFLIPHS